MIFLEGKSILQPYPGLPNPGRSLFCTQVKPKNGYMSELLQGNNLSLDVNNIKDISICQSGFSDSKNVLLRKFRLETSYIFYMNSVIELQERFANQALGSTMI